VSDAIRELEDTGFVDVHRRGLRVANHYSLTWLAVGDKPPTNRWKLCKVQQEQPKGPAENQKSGYRREPRLGTEGNPDGPNLGTERNPVAGYRREPPSNILPGRRSERDGVATGASKPRLRSIDGGRP
jgi:hypothetical protein